MIERVIKNNIGAGIIKRLSFAWQGFKYLWAREFSWRLEITAAVLVFLLAWILGWSSEKYLWLIAVCVLVLAAEIINTIIERLLDVIAPKLLPTVARIKDMLAALVLLMVVMSVVVGIILFLR